MQTSEFKISEMRLRAKRTLRRRHKKHISLTEVKKIWDEYVEYGIIRPLLKYGRVDIDSKMSIEIVGRKVANYPIMYNLLSNGRALRKDGKLQKAPKWDGNRPGVHYKIELTDKNYTKGQLIFEADPKLKKAVHEALKNTQTYYRIVA